MGPEKILVVEDNPMNRELVTEVLQGAGFEVVHAADGDEAIAMVDRESPALVLMDVALPGIDGLTAMRAIKANPRTRHVPVVVMSAHAMRGDEEKAREAGCDAYYTKPIDTRALPRALAEILARRRG